MGYSYLISYLISYLFSGLYARAIDPKNLDPVTYVTFYYVALANTSLPVIAPINSRFFSCYYAGYFSYYSILIYESPLTS
jgi:hypothetical protein